MLEIEINMGSLCNYKCSYCFENGENAEPRTPAQVSEEHLIRLAEYIAWLKEHVYADKELFVRFYGGEPFLYMDKIQSFVRAADPYLWGVSLITNGSLVKNNIAALTQMRADNQANILTNVSYDYALQNETRNADSYEEVRAGIRLLYKNDFTRRTISTFAAKNIHRINEVFFDFVALREELPELQAVFNMDRFGPSFSTMNEEALTAALKEIRSYLWNHPEMRGTFVLNSNVGRTRKDSLTENFYGNIAFAMYHDGSLYPSYESALEPCAELLKFAHVEDSFEEIEQKREAFLASVPHNLPEACTTCDVSCRVIPWRTMKTSLSEWNGMPDAGHCHVHQLLGEYLA